MKKSGSTQKILCLRGWIALTVSLAIYAVIFWVAEKSMHESVLVLAVIPVIGGSWYLGVWGGVLSTTLALLVSALLFEVKGYSSPWMILLKDGLVGTIVLYIIVAFLGHLGELKRRYEDRLNVYTDRAKNFEAQAASLTTLVNITNEALDADDLNSVLDILAEEMRKMFNANDCLISFWDSRLVSYYSRTAVGGEAKALMKLPPIQENADLALFQNADILIYGDLEEISDTWRVFGTVHPQGSLLALPLGSNGQKIGVLHLLYEYHHNFPPDKLSYAKLASRQLSQIVWKVVLLTHAHEQVEELHVLHQVSLVLSTANDEHTLLDKTLDVLGDLLYHQNLTIVLIDEAYKVLGRSATYRLNTNEDVEKLVTLGEGITGRVAQTGILERYDDVRKAPGYIAALPETRSEICVPLKSREKVLGVINIESDKFAAFDERDERILTTVANQIGVALIRLRAEQAQIERVNEIARAKDLIQGLTEVAAEMEMSSDPIAVMKQMGIALDRKGWKVLIALIEPDSLNLVVRYTSLDPEIIKKIERVSNQSMKDFRASIDSLPASLSLRENLKPLILKDYIPVVAGFLQGLPSNVLRRILNRTLDTEKMTWGHFPLVYREKILGFLWLWGAGLGEDDLPALSVFANQVAATLENARLFADVQRLAITDELTQLYTRRHFFEVAYEEFYHARRYGRPLSIIMFDLDHFKRVNDTYGHAVGDVVLENTALACRKTLRANDVIGRYGGEEIVILLVETDLNAAAKVATRILDKVRHLVINTKKGDVQITLSGGVAGDNVEELNLIDMIEAADQALYRAKRAGRDQIAIAPRLISTADE